MIKHIISLGAGVQSSTMALMAAHGEITPMPDCAIFADTQAEPQSVYKWLDWLETQLPFPVYRVTKGPLAETATKVRKSAAGNNYTKAALPAFIVDAEGRQGLMMRQCTSDFKIVPIQREIRRLRDSQNVIQWIGISRDEAHRMKPARLSYVENRWPLIEKYFTRNDCLDWMLVNGYPEPPRSSCVFCPYHSDNEWRRLINDEPDEFAKAVEFDKSYREAYKGVTNFRGTAYLHRSCVPLGEVDFSKPSEQPGLFGNECEGVCGV